MKKFGFSLAEVLIALAIVGVIAAITLPTFVSSSQNKANASKLATTINVIENAFTTMMAAEGAVDLTETRFYELFSEDQTDPNAQARLAEYLKITGSGEMDDFYNGVTFRNTNLTNYPVNNVDYVYQLKNGALLLLTNQENAEITENLARQRGLSVTSAPLTMYIDVNGADGPNLAARDFFRFMVAENGTLYPVGGSEWARIVQQTRPELFLYTYDIGTFACTDAKKTIGCTARLVENNFVVDY